MLASLACEFTPIEVGWELAGVGGDEKRLKSCVSLLPVLIYHPEPDENARVSEKQTGESRAKLAQTPNKQFTFQS